MTPDHNFLVFQVRVPYASRVPGRLGVLEPEDVEKAQGRGRGKGLGPLRDLPILSKTGAWLIGEWPVKDIVYFIMRARWFLYLEMTYLGTVLDDVGLGGCKCARPGLKAEGTDVRWDFAPP